jgi:phage tail sheath protein FI
MSYQTPGVYIREVPAQTQVTSAPTTTTAVFLGTALRGPSTPTLITSWSNYTTTFGSLSNDFELGYAVYNYFANGGRNAYISRVTNPTTGVSPASAAAYTFSGMVSSTSTSLFALTAKSVGTWANSSSETTGLRAQLTFDQNTTATTVTGTAVSIDADTLFSLTITFNGNEVERWQELSLDPTSGRYVKDVLNLFSSFVNCGTPTTISPSSTMVMTVVTGTYDMASVAFVSGSNGTAPADDTAKAVIWDAVLQQYSSIKNPLIINLVGQTAVPVVNKALEYSATRGDSFVIIDCPLTATSATVDDLDYGTATTKAYGALYFPALVMGDPARSGPAALRTCFPGGAVAGAYVRSETTRGVAKAPAGYTLDIANVYGLATTVTETEEATLYNTKGINTFRSIPGGTFIINGARTLSTTRADKFITVRRSMNFVKSLIEAQTQFAVFEPNDSRLWDTINNRLSAILSQFWASGNLKGASTKEAFYIVCDETNNTATSIADGFVNVEVGVSLLTPAEFIVINISQYSGFNA